MEVVMGPAYSWPWEGPMWVFPTIMPIIMLVIVIVGLYLIFGRGGFCAHWQEPNRYSDLDRSPESALEILKKRYAKGEITQEEFERMKQDILS
jgi:putative membrane protein